MPFFYIKSLSSGLYSNDAIAGELYVYMKISSMYIKQHYEL